MAADLRRSRSSAVPVVAVPLDAAASVVLEASDEAGSILTDFLLHHRSDLTGSLGSLPAHQVIVNTMAVVVDEALLHHHHHQVLPALLQPHLILLTQQT